MKTTAISLLLFLAACGKSAPDVPDNYSLYGIGYNTPTGTAAMELTFYGVPISKLPDGEIYRAKNIMENEKLRLMRDAMTSAQWNINSRKIATFAHHLDAVNARWEAIRNSYNAQYLSYGPLFEQLKKDQESEMQRIKALSP